MLNHLIALSRTLPIYILLGAPFSMLWAQSFLDQTHQISSPFSSSQPVGVVDMNGDKLDDIVRLDFNTIEIQYQQQDGSFIGQEGPVPYFAWGLCVGDLDKNGFNDVVYGGQNEGSSSVQAVMMDASGVPNNSISVPASIFIQGINTVDIDLDGWTDVYACHDNAANKTFANSSGVLSEDPSLMPSSALSGNYASNWCDYDNDGDFDVYISKCRLGVTDPEDPRRINIMWRNSVNGFQEAGATLRINDGSQSWSSDFGDIDNDGDMDLFVLNHTGENKMFRNVNFQGQFFFIDIAESAGLNFPVASDWQAFFADFDNDGFLDLLVTGVNNEIFHNNGDNTFTPLEDPFPTNLNIQNAAIGDLNRDGHLDIYATFGSWATSTQDTDKLYINDQSSGNNWVAFELTGTTSNINAIGARLELYGSWGKQIRDVQGGQGYGIMNSFNQHFGIGTATAIDSLVVKWPNGLRSTFDNLEINQYHSLLECVDTVNLVAGTDDFTSGQTSVIAAKTTISANNKIGTGANITYQAGESVDLDNPFETERDANFTVKIGGCDE